MQTSPSVLIYAVGHVNNPGGVCPIYMTQSLTYNSNNIYISGPIREYPYGYGFLVETSMTRLSKTSPYFLFRLVSRIRLFVTSRSKKLGSVRSKLRHSSLGSSNSAKMLVFKF